MGGVSFVGLCNQNLQPQFSIFLEDFVTENFEEEMAIIHEENVNVVNVEAINCSDAQEKKYRREVEYCKKYFQNVQPYNKAFLKRLLDPCLKLFGP